MITPQEEVAFENELRRLERAHARVSKKIDAFKAGELATRPYRYALDFQYNVEDLDGVVNPTLPATERSFTVRNGTIFLCKSLTFSFAIQGTLASNSQNATIPVGPNGWKIPLDFNWRVRDTGMQREWQNTALPAGLLSSGCQNPLKAGNGHARLPGGTEVFFTLIPTTVSVTLGATNPFDAITAYNVQIVFGGQEVVEASE